MYQFKYGGKEGTQFTLIEAKDLVVVRSTEDLPIQDLELSSQSRDLVPNLMPVAAFPESNVTVYKCHPSEERSALSLRNAVRKTLPSEESIRFAGRALKDPVTGSIVVYTENLYIQFTSETVKLHCEKIISDHGLQIKEELGFARNAYFVKAISGTGLNIFNIADALLSRPEVQYCHPELVRERKHKFVHPMQWHLKETNINGMNVNQHAHCEAAWEKTRGAGITIAILDDGVDIDHPDFQGAGKVVFPRDTVLNTDNPRPKHPSERHGTACAGVACANGTGKAFGVAPDASLMPIRVGSIGSISEAKAFQWAADNGADIISCSWGPEDGAWWNPSDPLHFSRAIIPDSARTAIDYAVEKGREGKGCIITWAAGNGNEDVKYDEYASYPKVIAVAACNDTGSRSIYSDYGDAVWCSFPSNDFHYPAMNHPKPLTPGIWTTDRAGAKGYNFGGINAENLIGDLEGNYTATFGGTSSACPGVAGVVALILAIHPDLSWQQVREIIKISCDRIDEQRGNYDANGHSPFYGYGRVNALRALQNAEAAKTKAPDNLHFEVAGSACFTFTENAIIKSGEPAGEFEVPERLLGLQLHLEPFHPDLQIVYQTMIRGLGPSLPGKDGSYSGTKDRRRSVVGLSIRLEGPFSHAFDVEYSIRLKGVKRWANFSNGGWAGSARKNAGKSLEAIRVHVKRR
jgi:subtilisin family serine protease